MHRRIEHWENPMPYYPNWKQICKIDNDHLRMAMYTASGQELNVLQRSFPLCFSRRRLDLCVPVSFIREKAERWSAGERYTPEQVLRDREQFWEPALGKLGIPTAFEWRWRDLKEESEEFEGTDLIPDDVWAQLEGKPFRCGHVLTFRGEEFIVVNCMLEHYETFSRKEGEGKITVAHSRFIDLNS